MGKRIGILRRIKNEVYNFLIPNKVYFSNQGYCPCCEKQTVFRATNQWFRDYYFCTQCYSIPRERALILVLNQHFPNWKSLAIHESSPGDRGASLLLQKECVNYTASQFFPSHTFGALIDGARNENLEHQTFPDSSFDLVITQDVMEHIYDPASAFAEIARTLKPGGAHIFTTPLVNKHKASQVWATLSANGDPNFLYEPEYHQNPVDSAGSPVTMHWGFDIVDFIELHSGLISVIESIDDLSHGIRGEYIEVVISKKI